jgi:hypothetical protein
MLGMLALTPMGCARGEARSWHAAPPKPQQEASAKPVGRSAVVLAEGKRTRVVVVVPPRLQAESPRPASPHKKPPKPTPAEKLALAEQQRLQASVQDLTRYLGKISGATVPTIQDGAALDPGSIPILIAESANRRFGAVGTTALGGQGFRVVVRPDAIGLFGESDLGTGYAIYELLDRLGCRWYMPGELGEVIPHRDLLALDATDEKLAPTTLYRDLWYADLDYKRRNRLGGVQVAAGHMLEKWITPEEREAHPDFRAQVKGEPHATRLRWSNPRVADAIADGIRRGLEKRPAKSVSISPADGTDFDDTFDTALDAGDWDPTTNSVSLTDRLLVVSNRVASNLAKDNPELTLGLLAYVSYTRPPVREKVHPSVVPVIAPITYCRQHPWSDDACPGAKDLRSSIEGWSKHAERLAFRGYAFNLAEPAAPNPMMRKWSADLPFLFQHHVRFFQPETLPNFETSLPALYLSIRLAWDAKQNPEVLLQDLFERFYGSAAPAARAYLDWIDRAWVDTPEFAGGGLGYARRFTPAVMKEARRLLERARAACRTDAERQRVGMLADSLAQHELYMRMDTKLRDGNLSGLLEDYQHWQSKAGELSEKYAPNFAFGKARWAKNNGVYANYVERFLGPVYAEADRINREDALLTTVPLCQLRYRLAPDATVPNPGPAPELGEADPSMNVCVETWSSIRQDDYFGAMWYQADLDIGSLPSGKRAFLWLSKLDGVAQAWVNGTPIHPRDSADGEPTVEAHLKSATFELATALHAGRGNRLSVLVRRTRLAELGAGGLLGPAYLYRER